MMGDVWDDFREKREMPVIMKDVSGLPGSHREGEFPWQGTGDVRRCAHSSGCEWVGRGAAGPALEDLECQAREQTLPQGC